MGNLNKTSTKKLSSSKWSKVYQPRTKGAAPMTVHLPEVNFVFAHPDNANATRVVAAAPPTVSVRDAKRWPRRLAERDVPVELCAFAPQARAVESVPAHSPLFAKTAHGAPTVNVETPANAVREENALSVGPHVEPDAANAVAHASVEVPAPALLETVLDAPRPVPRSAAHAVMTAKTRMVAVSAPRVANALLALLLAALDAVNAVEHASAETPVPALLVTVLDAPRPVPRSAAHVVMTAKTRMVAVSAPREANALSALLLAALDAVNAVDHASAEADAPALLENVPDAPTTVLSSAAHAAMTAKTRMVAVNAPREANAQSAPMPVEPVAVNAVGHANVEAPVPALPGTVPHALRPAPRSAAPAVITAKTQRLAASVPREANAPSAPLPAVLDAANAVDLANVVIIAPARLEIVPDAPREANANIALLLAALAAVNAVDLASVMVIA